MKKIVKMSLVAAVAVAGLTTANAKPLEEAIKDVDVSGTVVYRYNDAKTKNTGAASTHGQTNNYKIGLNLSSKVNDDVKLNTRFIVGDADLGFASLNSATTADGSVGVELSNVYFGYTGIKNTTVNVGKQGLTTPWTVAIDSDGNEQTGTGILALSTWGPVTVAAAYFNQTNLDSSGTYTSVDHDNNGATANINALNTLSGNGTNAGAKDVVTLGAIANVGPVTVDAWYLDMADIFDTYTLGAKAGFDVSGVQLGADVRYTSLSFDTNAAVGAVNATNDDHDMLKLELSAKAGIVDALYRFAKTDKEGGIVTLDNDATTTTQGWSVRADGKNDASYHQFVLGVQAMDNLHVSANYVTVEYEGVALQGSTAAATNKNEDTEIYAQVVYNMSKNLMTYVRFGQEERKDKIAGTKAEDDYKGRLQIQYSF
ncbi:MAG: porin [Sulfurimonadaceae bacterium]